MSNLYRIYGIIRLLQFNRSITNVLAYNTEAVSRGSSDRRKYPPSISFQAFKKSSGSEKATKPNFAYKQEDQYRRDEDEGYLHTFPLSRSRITLAFWKDVYLLNALAKTSSDTSLLRSPTNRRNQAKNTKVSQNVQASILNYTHKDSTPATFDPPRPCLLPSAAPSCVCHP